MPVVHKTGKNKTPCCYS